MRSEDINARQVQRAFADGATLAELEQHIAYLRSLGAPDDAHPRAGVNDDYEITVMICVVQRPAPQAASACSLSPATGPGLRASPSGRTVRPESEGAGSSRGVHDVVLMARLRGRYRQGSSNRGRDRCAA